MVRLVSAASWALSPKGLYLSALLSVGSGLDAWARRAMVHHHVSFAAVNAGGFTACAVILWILRSLGVVWFRSPSQATIAALLPSASALVFAVLAAQQAIRYGNVVVHSIAQHLVPLFAAVLDFLATGSAPHSGELTGCLLVLLGATASHFESYEMSFAINIAALFGAIARTLPAIFLLGSIVRVKRIYGLGTLEMVFGCTAISAAILMPVAGILSPQIGGARRMGSRTEAGGAETGILSETLGGFLSAPVSDLAALGVATLLHRILQIACVLESGALTSAMSEEFAWAYRLPAALVAAGAAGAAADTFLWHAVAHFAVMFSGVTVYARARQQRLGWHRTRRREAMGSNSSSSSGPRSAVPCSDYELEPTSNPAGTWARASEARDRSSGGQQHSGSSAPSPPALRLPSIRSKPCCSARSCCEGGARSLPALALVLAAAAVSLGPLYGHALAPWRWRKDGAGWQLGALCGLALLAAAALPLWHPSGGQAAGGAGGRGRTNGARSGASEHRKAGVYLMCFLAVTVDVCCRLTVVACCHAGNNCLLCSAGIVSQVAE